MRRFLRETLIADPGPTALLCPGGVPHAQTRQWECRQGARTDYSPVSMLFLKTNKTTKLNLLKQEQIKFCFPYCRGKKDF